MPRRTVFLLSPANVNGKRGRLLASPTAEFPTARAFRSRAGLPIGDAFAFMSALYFRGKITYARHFARTQDIFVIAPGYRMPLERDASQSRPAGPGA